MVTTTRLILTLTTTKTRTTRRGAGAMAVEATIVRAAAWGVMGGNVEESLGEPVGETAVVGAQQC
jgi:hypothetical protein